MMNLEVKQHIENRLNSQLKSSLKFKWVPIGGGSINNTYKIITNKQSYFVKTNTINVFKNGFREEVSGLRFLNSKPILIPEIIIEGTYEQSIYLVLEWIEAGYQSAKFFQNFAYQLSELHKNKGSRFGLKYTNFMGQLPQKNTFFDSFDDFFIENRLIPQTKLAFNNKLIQNNHMNQFESLYKSLSTIFPVEMPCKIHGDLWSGNFICNSEQKAVLIDPAVYYGHREVDLAMSQLFGGFSQEFYSSYQENYPLEMEFLNRKDIYNLYPLLIHLNLFGTSYLKSIEMIISKF